MIHPLLVLAGLAVVAWLWVALGVLNAVRSRIGDRVARWLLPDDQPSTFRVAQFIALSAQWLGPHELLDGADWRLIFEAHLPELARSGRVWNSPSNALAELDEALRTSQPVTGPLGDARPLLWLAIRLRVEHGIYRLQIVLALSLVFITGVVAVATLVIVGVMVFVFAPPVLVLRSAFLHLVRFIRPQLEASSF